MRPTLDHATLYVWTDYAAEAQTEYTQSVQEGLDIAAYKPLFDAVAAMPANQHRTAAGELLQEIIASAPLRADYPYVEPNDLEGIRAAARPQSVNTRPAPTGEELRSRIAGAWYGRIAGCMLGKTVEGIHTDELHALLKASGNWPMHRYILSTDITDELAAGMVFPIRSRAVADCIDAMPMDDDTNYTAMAQLVIDRYGRDFTPWNMGETWLNVQGMMPYCTAERVGFRNMAMGMRPPHTATWQNPYREWIGAQIRADYFGYINPGDPVAAADMAWRDASISHIKNGIYGEMWAAGMIAGAATAASPADAVRAGLGVIPAQSRLYHDISELLAAWEAGRSQADTFAAIHAAWDEYNGHDWCHTISNALVVTAALLYGEGDFGRSICMAVETGFDTDCNGATVGSVLGMLGSPIDAYWTAPFHGKLDTTIFGIGTVEIESLINKTMEHIN